MGADMPVWESEGWHGRGIVAYMRTGETMGQNM